MTAKTITILTDFGLRDHYVAALKGVMLSINPALNFVDITHLIPPGDIQSAAFTLGHAYTWFPIGTIHLAVVDPGVGTARKAIAASAGGHIFVAPDNGLMSWVLDREEVSEVFEITADHYFRRPVSSTFHGRDVFAPVAAWISRDVPLHQVGPARPNPVKLKIPALTRVKDTLIQAHVLAVDQFGNLITNLKPEDLPVYSSAGGRSCKVLIAQREITAFRRTFGDGQQGELFVIPGSTGYLEIVMREQSAAQELKVKPGDAVGVVLG
jgi:S-adenosyl-L-methionine hydrolase (adenosine-forming)